MGGRIDGRSDIYSLGVILYRMLGGKPPFNSPSMGEVIQMQLTAEPAPLITAAARDAARGRTSGRQHAREKPLAAASERRRSDCGAQPGASLIRKKTTSRRPEKQPFKEGIIRWNGQRKGCMSMRLLRGTFSTNVQRTSRFKPSALSATIIGAALVAGGYGLYHYVSGDVASDGRREMSQASVAAEPTPSTDRRGGSDAFAESDRRRNAAAKNKLRPSGSAGGESAAGKSPSAGRPAIGG